MHRLGHGLDGCLLRVMGDLTGQRHNAGICRYADMRRNDARTPFDLGKNVALKFGVGKHGACFVGKVVRRGLRKGGPLG